MNKILSSILLAVVSICIGLFFSWIIQTIYGISLFFFIYYIINGDVYRGGYMDLSGIFDAFFWLLLIIFMIIASTIALKFQLPQLSLSFTL